MIKHIGLVLAAVLFFISSSLVLASDDGLDRRIRVHNLSSKRIVQLYAAPIDYDVQSDGNMIHSGEDVIVVGQTKVVDIDDNTGYCRYNLRAVRADGAIAEKYDVNVCVLTDWWIYD